MTVVSTMIPPWFIFGWWNQTNSGLSPCRGGHYAAATVHCHSAATATLRGVVVHAKIVSQFVCQSHGSTQWVVRVILQRGWGRGQGITKHESVPAMCNLPERDFNWIKIKVKWQRKKKKQNKYQVQTRHFRSSSKCPRSPSAITHSSHGAQKHHLPSQFPADPIIQKIYCRKQRQPTAT